MTITHNNTYPPHWDVIDFETALNKVEYTRKVQKKDFLGKGKYPIISQEKESINGYCNLSEYLFKILKPVVIFGDHTKTLKFIDFDFVLGADGVKIFDTIDAIIPKYFYYYLLSNPVDDLGYSRHYKLLKSIKIPVPPLAEQERIVACLDRAFAEVDTLANTTQRTIDKVQDIWKSTLHHTLHNPHWDIRPLGDVADVIAGQSPKGDTYNLDGKGMAFHQGKTILGICTYEKHKNIRQGIQSTIKGSGGAVFDSINKEQIKSIKIPVPPISEQHRIVAHLQQVSEYTDALIAKNTNTFRI